MGSTDSEDVVICKNEKVLREQNSTDSAFEDHLSELSRTDSIASNASDEQSDGLAELPNVRSISKSHMDMRLCLRQEASRSFSVDSGYSTISVLSAQPRSASEDGQISAREIAKLNRNLHKKSDVSKIVDCLVDDLKERQAAHVRGYKSKKHTFQNKSHKKHKK